MSKKALKKYLALVIFSDKARRFLKYPRVEKDCWRRIEGYVRRDPNNRKKFEFSPRRPFLVGDKGRYSLSFIRIKKEFLGVDCDLIKDVDSSGQDQKYALAEVHIITGRTHQIRVHLSSIGMPIVGDSVYAGVDLGRTAKFQGVGLESYRISYIPSGVYGQLCENNNTEGSNSGLDRYPNQANEKSRKDCEWGRGRFAGFWDESTKRREISLPESIFADLL
jgi:23S rRNA-/tRNA-specific pseudouridylate synthase